MSDLPWDESEEYQQAVTAAYEARRAFFQTLGEPDADVWMPIINPMFMGGPAWPTRPGWQPIRCGDQTVIASSGLSDPFGDDEEPNIGFGVEVAVATTDAQPTHLGASWLLDLAQLVSHQAAADGRFHLRHSKFGTFLFGTPTDAEEFRDWVDDAGTMGFLVGVPLAGASTDIALPAGTAKLLVAKLLTPAEYGFVAARGLEGAQHLLRRFDETGTHHLSSLSRPSVV